MELASEAASEVVASCGKQGYAETAVVVDADGVRQAVLRGDRAGSHTLDSANDKAYTAASFKIDTSALMERAKSVAGFTALFTQLPHLILIGGGVVIKVGDETVGAIGLSGAPAAIWTKPVPVLGLTRSATSSSELSPCSPGACRGASLATQALLTALYRLKDCLRLFGAAVNNLALALLPLA